MKYSILLVEDDLDLCELNKELFEIEGFEVFTANSGNEALKALEEQKVNAIFSDVRMPDGDGLFLLSKVNELGYSGYIDFYFYTGYSDFSEEDVLKLGVMKLFHKPISIVEISREIKANLEKQ